MNKGYNYITTGCLSVFYGLFGLLSSNLLSLYIWFLILGISLIIEGIFTIKGYHNKTSYLAFFSLMTLLGITSVYMLLFVHIKYYIPYVFTGLFIFILIFGIREYLHRRKSFITPWKDEW